MTKLFSIRPGVTLKGREFKGLRGWAGKPFHPPFTDFPIVGYIFAGIFDVLSFLLRARSGDLSRDLYVAATYAMSAGAIASVATIVTGFWDWWKGIDREKTGPLGKAKHTQVWRTINWHATVMVVVSAIVVVDLILRWTNYNALSADVGVMALSVAAALLVSFGSFYGGELVFDFQFNVESLEGSTAWDETEVDQLPADRPQSEW
ncbi:MAG: DUF2231 domain-containing protein [Actinobacteria bacterium]|nr:DUF2231 domain-containing protein [Actinomycetota bacterium]